MNIIKFILIYALWFFSSIFITDTSFYQQIILPSFAPEGLIFGIVWPILYLLITLSIVTVIKESTFKDNKSYFIFLIINYIFNQLFSVVFFYYNNLFLGFVVSLFTFLSSLLLYNETYKINKLSSKLLVPYILWCLFATVLSLSIYLLN